MTTRGGIASHSEGGLDSTMQGKCTSETRTLWVNISNNGNYKRFSQVFLAIGSISIFVFSIDVTKENDAWALPSGVP